jgi:hypothetical protein
MLNAAVTLLSSGRIFIITFDRVLRSQCTTTISTRDGSIGFQSKSRSTEVNRLFYAWTALIAARPKRALTTI